MPIYEYVCLDCNKEFEALRSFKEADKPMSCCACGGMDVKRKLSIVSAQRGGTTTVSGAGGSCGSCAGGNCGSCGG